MEKFLLFGFISLSIIKREGATLIFFFPHWNDFTFHLKLLKSEISLEKITEIISSQKVSVCINSYAAS